MRNNKPTILYVDDEPFNLVTFAATFRRYYNILTCTSGKEGMEILRNNAVDLIITDQRMPEMTGVQFLEAVVNDYPDPVRMILTGFSDIEAITKAINTGSVLRYVIKPWDELELKQIIDMGIRIHDLELNGRLLASQLETELKKQKEIIDLFQKYVPEPVLNQILTHDNQNQIYDGEYRIISILFSDIRQFTKLSETLDPKELVAYLNDYYSVMVNCVIKNHGAIYKLMGDGLIALFGAPVSSVYNQRNAVYCALEMIKVLEEFNAKYKFKTQIGIGISTGETLVGHIRAENFITYVAIGDVIEMASKIQDLTHDIPNGIIINEPTFTAVKGDVEISTVKNTDGKLGNLYQVLSRKG